MKFYNRDRELAELRRIQDLSYSKNSRMTMLTGRRRIGKTSLMKKAFAEGETPMLYFFVGRKTEASLALDFINEIKSKLNGYIPEEITTIAGVMRFMFELAKEKTFTLVIDEFQEIAKVNPEIFSDLQNMWDAYRLQTRMNLVLSGSVQTMMNKIFTDNKEPLFGRADNIIRLRPFKIDIIKEILRDYNQGYKNEDLLALYSITGGIPKYIEQFCDNGYVTAEDMLKFVASDMSPFIEEGRYLLIQEFGKDYAVYFSILQAISEGYTTQGEITALLGGLSIGGHLERLENTYNVISKYRPLLAKPNSKNTIRFRITDNFYQFWFRFIEKYRSMIELENYDDLTRLLIEAYPTYSGLSLERYFRQKLAEEGGFKDIGSWWEPRAGIEASEIDIVGLRTEGKQALVAEVKRQRRNYDHKKFMSKVERISSTTLNGYEIQTKLFTMEDM